MVKRFGLINLFLISFTGLAPYSYADKVPKFAIEYDQDIFDGGSGQPLVQGLEKSCPHVRSEFRNSDPLKRKLLLADQNITKFYSGECDGICDIVQLNRIVIGCKKSTGKPDCIIYGAIFSNKIYQIAIDAYGKTLEDACKDG